MDSRDQLRFHGSSSMGGVQESAFLRRYWGDSDAASPALYWDPLSWGYRANVAPYSNQLESFYSKGALVWNLALIQPSLLLCTFFSMTTWSLSAIQDKITDNKGLENNQSVSTEATILHLCKDKRRPCTHWTAVGHPNGDHQGTVIKGRGSRRKKSPMGKQP